jgi:hypothetical protein
MTSNTANLSVNTAKIIGTTVVVYTTPSGRTSASRAPGTSAARFVA